MIIRVLLAGCLFLMAAFDARGNVTLSFETAMIEAPKVALVAVQEIAGDKIKVKVERCFKGAFGGAVVFVNKVGPFHVKKFKVGSLYYILMDENNMLYKTSYACGAYTVLEIKLGKIANGIFRYASGSWSKNDSAVETTAQISNAIEQAIPVALKGKIDSTLAVDRPLAKDQKPLKKGSQNVAPRELPISIIFILVFVAGFFSIWVFKRMLTSKDSVRLDE